MAIVHPIPALSDNYIWTLADDRQAWVVDPGDAVPVLEWLAAHQRTLAGILLTHHHADHTGGVPDLQAHTGVPAFGPAYEDLPSGVQRLSGGQRVNVLGHAFEVIDVPGHTAGHIAYYSAGFAGTPVVLCGDTLFSGGCGRLFEGTPDQMLASLDALAALPTDTRVCCTHEYTLSNLRFARTVEPDNPTLAEYQAHCTALRDEGRPTLPSTIAQERAINPFLRTREPAVRAAICQQSPGVQTDAEVFAALRRWKDGFR